MSLIFPSLYRTQENVNTLRRQIVSIPKIGTCLFNGLEFPRETIYTMTRHELTVSFIPSSTFYLLCTVLLVTETTRQRMGILSAMHKAIQTCAHLCCVVHTHKYLCTSCLGRVMPAINHCLLIAAGGGGDAIRNNYRVDVPTCRGIRMASFQ
jgi:hypothetical protein